MLNAEKMKNGKLGDETQELAKAAQNMTYAQYGNIKKLRTRDTLSQQHIMIAKQDGAYANDADHTTNRWAEWIMPHSQIPTGNELPEIDHITENRWRQLQEQRKTKQQIHNNTQRNEQAAKSIAISLNIPAIGTSSPLHKHLVGGWVGGGAQIRKWLTESYKERGFEEAISQLQNIKAHGGDGIPGEA